MEKKQLQDAKSEKPNRRTRLPFLLGLLIALIASACVFYFAGPRFIDALLFFSSVLFTSFLVAVIPVIAVIAVSVFGLISSRRLAYCSMALFLLSMVTPALRLGGDLVMGYAAFVLSYGGTFMIGSAGTGANDFPLGYLASCIMGAAANTLFVIGYLGLPGWSSIDGKGLVRVPRWSAVGLWLALLVIVPLIFATKLNGIYLGYGLWVAAFVALSLGSSRMHDAESKDASTGTK